LVDDDVAGVDETDRRSAVACYREVADKSRRFRIDIDRPGEQRALAARYSNGPVGIDAVFLVEERRPDSRPGNVDRDCTGPIDAVAYQAHAWRQLELCPRREKRSDIEDGSAYARGVV